MFLVVHEDRPIYEMDFSGSERQVKEYFLIHSSLDNVDLILKSKKDYFLGPIKSDDLSLYAYVNSVQIKFILVLGQKKDIDKNIEKNIKQFFSKANEAIAVALLNPLYRQKQYIKSSIFEEKIKLAAKQHLRGITGGEKKK